MSNKDKWSALSMKERADFIKKAISAGITKRKDIIDTYNTIASEDYADIEPAVVEVDYPRENEVWKRADSSNADMVQRLRQGSSRVTIPDWEDPRKIATHKMMSAGKYAVGNVQNINGQLFDFTDPKHGFKDPDRAAIDSAIKRGDYIEFDTEGDARYFAEHYKKHYNSFGPGGDLLKAGASFIPVVGTVIDGIDLVKDPSWENAGYFVGSLASDVLGLTAIKGLAKTAKALKAVKAVTEVEKATTAARYAKLASKTKSIDKLNNAKKSARAAGDRGKAYYNDLVSNRKLLEAKVAADNAEAKFKLASGTNLFYDIVSQGVQTLEPYVQHYNGGKLNKFVTGGPTEEKYNIFEDKLSFERRNNHRKSLEDFVKQNPTIGGINTADFVEFFNQLSGLESSYRKDAGNGMRYSGYYGLEGGRDYDESTQHKKAYEYLARLFKSSIVKEDLARGIKLGFTPAQILAKYWNQGNRVTNYLYNGINDSDGVDSLISDYGWNMTADVDYSNYLPQGITDDYVIVKDWRTLGRTIPLVRNSYINYSDRENSIIDLNTKIKRARTGNPNVVFDPNRLQVNDTIWLRPLTFKEKVK